MRAIHPSQLKQAVCGHCLELKDCERLPVMESPPLWAPEFDPNKGPKLHVIEICGSCQEMMRAEQPRIGRNDPRSMVVGDALDADVVSEGL